MRNLHNFYSVSPKGKKVAFPENISEKMQYNSKVSSFAFAVSTSHKNMAGGLNSQCFSQAERAIPLSLYLLFFSSFGVVGGKSLYRNWEPRYVKISKRNCRSVLFETLLGIENCS